MGKRTTLPRECMKCRFYFACRGECPKHRFDRNARGEARNTLCPGLKDYFRFTQPYFEKMRDLLIMKKAPAKVMPWAAEKLKEYGQ